MPHKLYYASPAANKNICHLRSRDFVIHFAGTQVTNGCKLVQVVPFYKRFSPRIHYQTISTAAVLTIRRSRSRYRCAKWNGMLQWLIFNTNKSGCPVLIIYFGTWGERQFELSLFVRDLTATIKQPFSSNQRFGDSFFMLTINRSQPSISITRLYRQFF